MNPAADLAGPAVLLLMLALAGGGMLGTLYYGGLWWTILKAAVSPQPELLRAVSLVLRAGLVLAGLLLAWCGGPGVLGACLLGLAAGRAAVMRRNAPEPWQPHAAKALVLATKGARP